MEETKIEETKVKKSKEKKIKKTKTFKAFVVLDILFFIFLFFTYGPISYFRDLLVTTAMGTWHHQYLAYIFYNQDMVRNVLGNNYISDFDFNTDTSKVKIGDNDTTEYESIYEEQVLKKDPNNDVYKVIEIKGTNYVGRMVVVYDSTRVSYVQSKRIKFGGQILDKLAKDNEALVATNASGFTVSNKVLTPVGSVIKDGKVLSDGGTGCKLIGFNNEGIMMLTTESASDAVKKGMKYGMTFGPFLIVNGTKADTSGSSVGGIAPRTAIGQRKDGIVLMLSIDGRRAGYSLGATFDDMIEVFNRYGAINAANLDGGGSSSMYVNGEIISVPGGYGYDGERYLPDAWIVK